MNPLYVCHIYLVIYSAEKTVDKKFSLETLSVDLKGRNYTMDRMRP